MAVPFDSPVPRQPDTRPPRSALRVRPRELPPAFTTDARRRLQWVGPVTVAGFSAGVAINYLMAYVAHEPAFSGPLVIEQLVGVGGILLGIAFTVASRHPRVPAELVMDLALLVEVAGAFLIGAMEQTSPSGTMMSGVSWIAVWIAIFPFLATSTPGKMVLAAFASASMGPLAFLFAVAGGRPVPDLHGLLHLFLPSYVVAAIVLGPALSLNRLRRQVEEARELGSYRLMEPLGRGGMGEVWLAEHRMLARPAAIKLIRADGLAGSADAQTMLRRFEREARATARLYSPHTVALYDFGTTDQGLFYYVMELLDGVDLELLVQRHGAQPPERVAHFLAQACESLQEAHAAGMVHRDIKPANLYACRLGARVDHLKVLDFGLVAHDDVMETRLTRTDVAAGTPAYLPPETLRGERADGRADLYSLGCVGYYLLSGRLVFTGNTPVETAIQHLQATPPRPSEHAGVALPEALEAILLRCLAKQPADRFADAGEMRAAIERSGVADAWTTERAQAWWSQHRPPRRSTTPRGREDDTAAPVAKAAVADD